MHSLHNLFTNKRQCSTILVKSMLFERIVSEGISHIPYLIGSNGQAAVIDPRRDCECYLEIARRNDLVITHIFETHRNEDYVIGSRELANLCGADKSRAGDRCSSYVFRAAT